MVHHTPSDSHSSAGEHHGVSGFARTVHGWSWQAFPIGMGTGAVYVSLAGLKQHSDSLTMLETFFYFLNMAFFLFNSTTLIIQAVIFPRQSIRLIQDPVKGIFVPLIVLSFATIIIGTINYAVPTGHISREMVYALFWIYTCFAIVTSFTMLMIWYNKPHDLNVYTPAYAFLIFPMMLVGVVGLNVLRVMDPQDGRAVGVLFVSYFFQGMGFFMTFIYIIIYIIRIMTTGFLDGHQANGAFVACGPPGFTALALIRLGERAEEILHAHNLISPNAGEIWFAASVLGALVLFGLAIFLFVFGVLPYWFKVHKHLCDILGCWALTFPNVGWINTLRALGDVLKIEFFFTLHAIFAFLMLVIWGILIILTGVALYKGVILRSKPEDVLRDSKGFTRMDDDEEKRYATHSSHV